MHLYETLLLTSPDITASESSELEEQFENLIKNMNGTVKSFERWGKYRLAYPVDNNDYGVYFLSRFELDEEKAKNLLNECQSFFTVKYPHLVMRYMNTRLDSNKPLTYQKPDSLEDIPTQDVDKFLRENKMEGLLKSPSAASESSSIQEPDGDTRHDDNFEATTTEG